MSDDRGPALVVGLGNPGPDYAGTRHNVGYRVVEILARRAGVKLRTSKTRAHVADIRDSSGRRVLLARPATWMNESGIAVGQLVRFFGIPAEDLVVVHDELDLPFGAVRVKQGGGTAGHKGLRSIHNALQSAHFARVRIGIGRPPGMQDAADYVLRHFARKEEEELGHVLEEAADAALAVVAEGAAAAQNRYNAPRP